MFVILLCFVDYGAVYVFHVFICVLFMALGFVFMSVV